MAAAKQHSTWNALAAELAEQADKKRSLESQRFFQTDPGGYAEGDRFLGIPVPVQRKIALRFKDLPITDIQQLLRSPIHEERFCGLVVLISQYERGDDKRRDEIFDFYLSNTSGINNWDLVDNSAPRIVGDYLLTRPRKVLTELAASDDVWRRRIAIIATLRLIKHGELATTYLISRMLLADKHGLIHKAVGWALRETGKVSEPELIAFLKDNFARLPRTALRYAIERFPPKRRKRMLAGNFDE